MWYRLVDGCRLLISSTISITPIRHLSAKLADYSIQTLAAKAESLHRNNRPAHCLPKGLSTKATKPPNFRQSFEESNCKRLIVTITLRRQGMCTHLEYKAVAVGDKRKKAQDIDVSNDSAQGALTLNVQRAKNHRPPLAEGSNRGRPPRKSKRNSGETLTSSRGPLRIRDSCRPFPASIHKPNQDSDKNFERCCQ